MAQLVERFICNEEVRSSNLLGSTIIKSADADFFMVNPTGDEFSRRRVRYLSKVMHTSENVDADNEFCEAHYAQLSEEAQRISS